MPKIFDVSMELRAAMATWPDSRGFRTSFTMSIAGGDAANVSQIDMDVHAGTHVETSLHFMADGEALVVMPLERLIGAAEMALVDGPEVTADALEALGLPSGAERLLLKTRNSAATRPMGGPFDRRYTGLTPGAARWIVGRGIRLVGIDYLSIGRFADTVETHRVLMRAGVAIVEGLDLRTVEPGRYTMVCLPLRIAATEAAPARVILMDDGGSWT
jgi:arylformamidase